EKLQDIRIRAVTERAEERRGQKFAAALFAIEVNVKQIAGIELRFIPGTAIRNDAEAVQRFAVRMLGGFESQTGRTMQLADDDAFGAVDDERALRRHERKFAHEHFFFLGPLLFLEEESDVERGAVGDAFARAFEPIL